MTSGWSIKAMMHIVPPYRGHSSGSASYTFLINSAQRCLNTDEPGGGGISTGPAGDPCGGWLLCLLALPQADVAMPAIVPDQMFALIRDVGGDGREPIEHRKHIEVAREYPMHL